MTSGRFMPSMFAGMCFNHDGAFFPETMLFWGTYNSGNYGLPLSELAYPGAGPAAQTFVMLTQNFLTFTVGLAIAAEQRRAHHAGQIRPPFAPIQAGPAQQPPAPPRPRRQS
mgnify:CR=1 FL=1